MPCSFRPSHRLRFSFSITPSYAVLFLCVSVSTVSRALMMRFRQTSIVLSEKDIQYHLERMSLRQKARVSQLPQPHVHHCALDCDDAVFIGSEAHFIDSISDCVEQESISSSISDANNDTSWLQEDIQDTHASPPPSTDKETQCGLQESQRKRTVLSQDLSETEELTDRLHCDCNRTSLVDGNLHMTDSIAGAHQHTDSFFRSSLLNEFVSSQASSSKAIDESCLYRQLRSPVLPKAQCDLTEERGRRMFRTSQDFTSSSFHQAKGCLLDLEPRERFSHSLHLFLQRSLTAPKNSRHSEPHQPIDSSQIEIPSNTVDLRLQPSHSISFPAAHYFEKELTFRKSLMEDYSRKPSEVNGHRRVHTLSNVSIQNNNTDNTDDGLCVAEATNAPVAPDEHKIPEHGEQGPNAGPLSLQGESVGDIFKRRMKEHRRLIRWKAWFEAQQIFINTTGEQFAAENQGQGPVLVPEPTWLHRQAALMGQEAVRIAQQVPYMEQRPAFEAQIASSADAPQNGNQVAGADENRMPAVEEEDPPPLASSKQSLAEYLIFKKRPSARRRNSEPTDIKDILHLTAFENATAFRDYIDATTAELDNPFAQDDAADFGLLALRDRPVAEWGRD